MGATVSRPNEPPTVPVTVSIPQAIPDRAPPPATRDDDALARNRSNLGNLTTIEFYWNFAATSVYVTGAWDNWCDKSLLSRHAPDEFSAALSLPSGTFQYKFIVDGTWKHNPTLPTQRDSSGNMNNMIVVAAFVNEYDAEVVGTAVDDPQPRSPPDSYNFSIFPQEDQHIEPPVMPRMLMTVAVDSNRVRRDVGVGTEFVQLNHVFETKCDTGYGHDASIETMAAETRFKSKVVTTILISSSGAPGSGSKF